jgi:hypothetical protein
MNKWVVCRNGRGYLYKDNIKERLETNFDIDSVGLIEGEVDDSFIVWLIGSDNRYVVKKNDTQQIDVTKTGDKYDYKICNICHCLKPVEQYDKNQNNLHGIVRRPSCRRCRTNIDKRPPRTKQAKEMEKKKSTPPRRKAGGEEFTTQGQPLGQCSPSPLCLQKPPHSQ